MLSFVFHTYDFTGKPPKADNSWMERINRAFPGNDERNLVENDQLFHYGISQYL